MNPATTDTHLWRVRNSTLEIGKLPLLMGIVNATPDSFSDGGSFANAEAAIEHALKLVEEGADIIDVGGESTRPGGKRVEETIEIERVVPVVEGICAATDIPVSIDTSKAGVARAAVEAGAVIINDVSGFRFDQEMAATAHELGTGVVLMHLTGKFETMHRAAKTDDIVRDVASGLRLSIEEAHTAGIGTDQIVVDVGIGFSKTVDQNIELLGRLEQIVEEFSGFPVLVGVSRKSFIGKLTGRSEQNRLAGTMAANCVSLIKGARILRVHDVSEALDAAKIVKAIWN